MDTLFTFNPATDPRCADRRVSFRCRDDYSLSDRRTCVVLGNGEALDFTFELGPDAAAPGTAEICLSGSLEVFDSHAYVGKFINSSLEVRVNGALVFGGLIHWRSHEETAAYWPIFDFPFNAGLLRPGRNTVAIRNTTTRAGLGEFFDARWLERFDAATVERKLATLYVSDIGVNHVRPPRSFPALAGVPVTAVAGEPFIVEVSTGPARGDVAANGTANADVRPLGSELEFGEHRSLFEVTAQRSGVPCLLAFTAGSTTLRAEVTRVYQRTGDLWLVAGPGAETTYWHQLKQAAQDFYALESGNCLRISIDDFLNNLHHIPLEKWIPLIRYLVRRRCRYALQRLRVPPYSRIPHAELKTLADLGPSLFAGVAVPEPVLFFAHAPEGRQPDLAKRIEAYRAVFKQRMEEIRLPGHPLVTFDSSGGMCGHYYDLGLDAQVSEIGPACNVLEEACSRGAARVYGKPWGVATAMHWYCGQGAQYAYDEARVRYAALTMLHSYLAGARHIVWEGGVFDNLPVYNFILSEESWRDFGRRYDDPRLREVRSRFRDLLDFHRAQQLPQPAARWGMVHGVNDMPIAYDAFASRLGDMAMARAWSLMKVFLPHVCLGKKNDPGRPIRRWYSATPHGQMDVVPAASDAAAFGRYRLLVFSGWNTMTPRLYGELVKYVRAGGTLFLSTAHLACDTIQKLEWSFVNGGDASALCGVKVKDLGGRIEEARFRTDEFAAHLPQCFVLSRKNPLFLHSFDETYPVFERDVTYFGGELELCGAEVLAVSQRGEPVVLRHRIGAGQVVLFNSYCHPGRGNFLPLAEGILRTLVDRIPTPVRIEDSRQVVSWFEYPGEGFTRYFFINTDWTQGDPWVEAPVTIGTDTLRLRLSPCRPLQVASDGDLHVILDDPAAQVAEWSRKNGRHVVRVIGAGGARCFGHGAAGAEVAV